MTAVVVAWRWCVALLCDGCADGWWREGDVAHFATEGQARSYATGGGWTVTADGVLCPDCALAVACAQAGHVWSDWQGFGPFPQSGTGGVAGRVRHCRICTCADWDPPLHERKRFAPMITAVAE